MKISPSVISETSAITPGAFLLVGTHGGTTIFGLTTDRPGRVPGFLALKGHEQAVPTEVDVHANAPRFRFPDAYLAFDVGKMRVGEDAPDELAGALVFDSGTVQIAYWQRPRRLVGVNVATGEVSLLSTHQAFWTKTWAIHSDGPGHSHSVIYQVGAS